MAKYTLVALFLAALLGPVTYAQNIPTAAEVVKKYADAIGGVNGWAIKNSEFHVTLTHNDVTYDGVIIKMSPGRYYETTTAKDFTWMQVYNSGRAVTITNGVAKAVTDQDELDELQLQSNILPDLVYTQLGYKLTMIGITKIKGLEHYAVKITSPHGAEKVNYYEKKSGLLKYIDQRGTRSFFTDYKWYKRRMLPFTIISILKDGSAMVVKTTQWFVNKKADPGIFDLDKY